jgi:hypothetical protein
MARNKIGKIDTFLDGLGHFGDNPLEKYHAAKAVRDGNLRVGVERRVAAAKKALKAFNVIVSIGSRPGRAGGCVRLYSPSKQIEILL